MADWERILSDLMEMYDYFFGCATNAAPNSKARDRFGNYTQTLANMEQMVRELMKAEDDGK